MSLAPLWGSGWITVLHALTALFAVVLGGIQLATRKGTTRHRYSGRLWVGIMALVALSSFGINEFRMLGPFSVIHLLSLLVLYSLWQSIRAVRNGDIALHRKIMVQLYVLALVLTGAFTMFPGRVFYRVFFGA